MYVPLNWTTLWSMFCKYFYPHVTHETTEALSGWMTCSRSYDQKIWEPVFEPQSLLTKWFKSRGLVGGGGERAVASVSSNCLLTHHLVLNCENRTTIAREFNLLLICFNCFRKLNYSFPTLCRAFLLVYLALLKMHPIPGCFVIFTSLFTKSTHEEYWGGAVWNKP